MRARRAAGSRRRPRRSASGRPSRCRRRAAPRPRSAVAKLPPPATSTPSAPAWTSMPAAISGLRPTWSESQPVTSWPSAPDDRIGGGDDRDLAHARAVRGEVQRRQAPGERVVEVVDQPRLVAGAQHRMRERGGAEGRRKPGQRLASCRRHVRAARRRRARRCRARTRRRRRGRPRAISAAPTQTTRAGRVARGESAGREARRRRRRGSRPPR